MAESLHLVRQLQLVSVNYRKTTRYGLEELTMLLDDITALGEARPTLHCISCGGSIASRTEYRPWEVEEETLPLRWPWLIHSVPSWPHGTSDRRPW